MHIHFILVEPAVPQNVGAAARAIKTMGFSTMRLVSPCDHLSDPARWLAHGSNEILEAAKIYPSLQQAAEGLDLLIGTTANQSRTSKQDYHDSRELPDILGRKAAGLHHIGLVFGREESGLTNEELQLCDMASSIPLATSYPSVNLGQAVMIYAYELSALVLKAKNGAEKPEGMAAEASYAALREKVEQLLQFTALDQNPVKANRIRERLGLINQTDLNLLHTSCSALLDKLSKQK